MKILKKIYNLLKKVIINIVCLRYLFNEEKTSKSNLGFIKKIKYLTKGFSSEKYYLYNFKENNHRKYLSDYQRQKTYKINNKYYIVIDDKILFEKIFKNDKLTPINYGTIEKGIIQIENQRKTIDSFINFIKEKSQIIIKKKSGGGGKGIFKVSCLNDKFYIDDSVIDCEELKKLIYKLDNSIIQEHIIQAEYSNDIYSGTVNTIRILTMRDPDTKEAFIATAVHKFGSERTKPVDNVWNGGMTALVDLETGTLQKSAYHHENNKVISWQENHPDTNKKIEGITIPNWDKVKESIIKLTDDLSFLHYVGWDVVVTDNGVKVIEGNNYSDVNILQIHEPLLKNDKIKKFYRYHNIIK